MFWRNVENRRRSFWREFERLQREAERLERSGRLVSAPTFPALNVWSSAEGVVITAEIPGVQPEDVDISVVGETLTLRGERKPEETDENIKYHRRERGCGQFTRTLQLPYRIEANNVEATFDKGVLKLVLPRAEADKPRKITIKTA